MGSIVNKLQAPAYDILPSFGGRCRKAVLGVSSIVNWSGTCRYDKVIWYRLTYHWVRLRTRDGQQFQAPPAKEQPNNATVITSEAVDWYSFFLFSFNVLSEPAPGRNCVKVEVAVLGSPVRNSLDGLCGRKATLNKCVEDFRLDWVSCVKVEVAVLGSSARHSRHRFPVTFLQTLPDLVTPLKGHSLSPRSCPPKGFGASKTVEAA